MYEVSVIIPVYGVEKYIRRCAECIFQQTYDRYEVIFVDDCSPDRSIEILRQVLEENPHMKSCTQIISHEHNKGLAGARLTGLSAAHGRYVLQLDSDDFVSPGMVEGLVSKALEEDSDIVICDYNVVEDGTVLPQSVNPSLDPKECMKRILLAQMHGGVWNKMIRRELYTAHGIAPVEGCDMCEDMSVTYKLFYFAKKVSYVPKPYYNYIKGRLGSYTFARISGKKQFALQSIARGLIEFREANAIEEKSILNAILYCRASILADLALNGELDSIEGPLFAGVPMKCYLKNPTLPFKFRLAGLFYKLRLHCFLKGLRSYQIRYKRKN